MSRHQVRSEGVFDPCDVARRDLRVVGVAAPVPNGSAHPIQYCQCPAFLHGGRRGEAKDIVVLEAVPAAGHAHLVVAGPHAARIVGVAGVDAGAGTVTLAGTGGGTVAWEPGRLAARAGGVEVYKAESMELRADDRIRWTRNDAGLGLVNSQTADVTGVVDGRVRFDPDVGSEPNQPTQRFRHWGA